MAESSSNPLGKLSNKILSDNSLVTVTKREKGGTHARTLPNPEALGPDIEEGAVNRRSLQALFPLPKGGAWPAAGPGAMLLQSTNYARVVISSKN